jgi:[ribosomal protein S5]-alanine N-acetyltransferase
MSVIETKRLIIREYSHNDIEKLNIILSNSITMSFWPAPFTLERTEAWVKTNMRRYKELGYGRWALISKDTGELIGDCGIMITEIDGTQEQDLGYIIHYPYWKNRFATEAAEACKEFALNDLGVKRLCANMAFNHEGSRKVAEKIGMKKEKEFYNKRNRDILTYLYSISNND